MEDVCYTVCIMEITVPFNRVLYNLSEPTLKRELEARIKFMKKHHNERKHEIRL